MRGGATPILKVLAAQLKTANRNRHWVVSFRARSHAETESGEMQSSQPMSKWTTTSKCNHICNRCKDACKDATDVCQVPRGKQVQNQLSAGRGVQRCAKRQQQSLQLAYKADGGCNSLDRSRPQNHWQLKTPIRKAHARNGVARNIPQGHRCTLVAHRGPQSRRKDADRMPAPQMRNAPNAKTTAKHAHVHGDEVKHVLPQHTCAEAAEVHPEPRIGVPDGVDGLHPQGRSARQSPRLEIGRASCRERVYSGV